MITLGELRDRILRLVADPTGGGYSDELLIDAIQAALDAILPWVPKTATTTLTGTGTAVSFDLPTDLYEIEAVVTSLGEVLPRAMLSPGVYLGTRSTNTNDWLESPAGKITFSKPLTTGEVYKIYYLAYWTKPTILTDPTAVLETPDIVAIGLSLYAAAYAILPTAISNSEIGQFKTRVDSGTPEHNPMQKTTLYLLDLFAKEMNRHPKHSKATK